MIVLALVYVAELMVNGVATTLHVTPSLQGGVVREPEYLSRPPCKCVFSRDILLDGNEAEYL